MSQKPQNPARSQAERQQEEEELKTLLQDLWKDTIAPHNLRQKVDKKQRIDTEMTIVSATSSPMAKMSPTVLFKDQHGEIQRAVTKVPGAVQVTHTPKGRQPIGDKTAPDVAKTMLEPGEGLEPADADQTFLDPEEAVSATRLEAESKTGMATETKRASQSSTNLQQVGTKLVGTSTKASSKSAGALMKAARKLASVSLSRLMIGEKVVVDAAQAGDQLAVAGEYEIERVLGKGGMGTVYITRQTSLDRNIALKQINSNVAENEDIQQAFLAEAAVTGELEHPNIVPIHDMGVTPDGLLFYTMKQVKGVPWKNVLKTKTTQENIEILMKVADAVAFGHSKGIIHRDLKPENVMLGEYGEVLVMDWGLAASVKEGGKVGQLTAANAAGGTPAYMAPEMATGNIAGIGTCSDVYLLGAILYEIVTGLRPHTGKDMMAVLYNIATNVIQPSDKKGELVDIALKAMATNPADRHKDVVDFQKAVRDTQKHFESIALAEKAEERLNRAHETTKYEDYAQALFGYQEALGLWDANKAAQIGELEARQAYAHRALQQDDLDLASSLIDPVKEKFSDLFTLIRRRFKERDARQKRLKVLTYGSIGMVALFLIGLTIGLVWINAERAAAKNAEAKAKTEKEEADRQRIRADEEKKLAEQAQVLAEDRKKLAEVEKEKAEEQRKLAVEATKVAEEQRKQAEEQRKQADEQRKLADEQRKEAERQKAVVLAQKTELEEAFRKVTEAKTAEERAQALAAQTGLVVTATDKWVFDAEQAKAMQAAAAKQTGLPVEKEIALPEDQQLKLVVVPATELVPGDTKLFVMGSPAAEENRLAEEYLHPVKLMENFYMAKVELTQGQWKALVGDLPIATESEGTLNPLLPVNNVSVADVEQKLLPALQKLAPEGWTFRLPTEAEWEYAARAGRNSTYYGGETMEDLKKISWFRLNSNASPQPVGTMLPNAFGIYDLLGNVSEMCHDSYGTNFYIEPGPADDPDAKLKNPVNKGAGKFKVVRGGSWVNLPQHCRAAYRSYVHPENRYEHLGVRVVMVRE